MNLYYQKTGKGPALIILHGLLGMSDNWMSIAHGLEDRFRVYALDQRNHGRSGWHEVFTYEAMAGDVAEFMEGHNISSAFMLGHSMGGKTAMQFAFDHPHKTEKLIVADISPAAYHYRHDALIDALLKVDVRQAESRTQVGQQLEEDIPDLRIRQFLLKNLHRNSEGGYRWKVNLEVLQRNLPEVFKAVEGEVPFDKPTLFVRGSESPYITEQHLPLIKQLFSQSRAETIQGASHWLHAEKPKEFIDLVREFLEA